MRRFFYVVIKACKFFFRLFDVVGERERKNSFSACRLVHKVDCFVGQEPVGNVSVRKICRRFDCLVGDFDLMVRLVLVAKTFQNKNRVVNRRLIHDNGLETPFECGVLFDIFTVFVDSRRADRLDFAPCEHGL